MGPGATGSAFLKVPVSARATAMGSAFTGASGDITALEYNPAGLVRMQRTDIRLTHISYLEDTSLQSVSAGFPMALRSRPGLQTGFEQDNLSLGLQYRLFRADDVARSEVGAKLDEFTIRDQLLQIGLGYAVMPNVALGVAGKYINNKIQDDGATNYAVDGGALFRLSPQWTLGASVLNLGPEKAVETEADPLPTQLRVGLARETERVLFTADAATGRDKVNRFSGGVEVEIGPYVRLRGGALHRTTLEFTGGLGIQFTGPQKAPHSRFNSSTRNTASRGDSADMISKKMAIMANSLIQQMDLPQDAPSLSLLAVLPLSSTDRTGPMLSELLNYHLTMAKKFTVMERSELIQAMEDRNVRSTARIDPGTAVALGRVLKADYVVVGSVERVMNKVHVNTRVVEVASALILATSTQEVADVADEKGSLRLANTPQKVSRSASFSNVDIGLDYAGSSNDELGFTHNITIRILY